MNAIALWLAHLLDDKRLDLRLQIVELELAHTDGSGSNNDMNVTEPPVAMTLNDRSTLCSVCAREAAARRTCSTSPGVDVGRWEASAPMKVWRL